MMHSQLGDFGFSIAQSDHSSQPKTDEQLGYLAPEYTENRELSFRTDVYAFGTVLLELITGLRPTDKILGGKSLVGWVRTIKPYIQPVQITYSSYNPCQPLKHADFNAEHSAT